MLLQAPDFAALQHSRKRDGKRDSGVVVVRCGSDLDDSTLAGCEGPSSSLNMGAVGAFHCATPGQLQEWSPLGGIDESGIRTVAPAVAV